MSKKSSRRRLFERTALAAVTLGQPLTLLSQATLPAPPSKIPTRQDLVAMAMGYQISQMLHVAAKLRIADLLRGGPRSTGELATLAGSHEDTLYRLMRTLASSGIFTEGENRQFSLNACAEYLRSGVPGSVCSLVEIAGEEWMWRPWGDLLHSTKTGQTAFDHLYGKGTFEWFAEHPDAGRLFDAGQAEITVLSAKTVVDAYDFSRFRRIVDIGGGDGTLLSAVLRANPQARGVLFDLDKVVGAARIRFDRSIAGRVEFAGGDFFKAVPGEGDLYLMKSILHDWNDEDCQKILTTARRSVPRDARLLVAEDLICGPNQPCAAKARDINMLVRTGGRNRTEQEYKYVLSRSGFRPVRTLPTASTLYLIEVEPS